MLKPSTARIHVIETPDVHATRRLLHCRNRNSPNNIEFLCLALTKWKQGRGQPNAPAAAYLLATARRPRRISDALKPKRDPDFKIVPQD
jgi:hypothetical protein